MLALVALVGTSCSEDDAKPEQPQPHGVTTKEAERMAVMRFLNYETGGRSVTIEIPSATGESTVTGSVDYERHLGYAVYQSSASTQLLQWNLVGLAVFNLDPGSTTPPKMLPSSQPIVRALQAEGSPLETALSLVLNFGADRPENALLLKRNGAQWMRSDEIDGTRVDVFSGPAGKDGSKSRLHYWLDEKGSMLRVEAELATTPEPVTMTYDTGPYQKIPALPGFDRK